MEYILEMKNITKTFPGVIALKNANLQIRAGEVHALVGENGAGKSTLMKILLGIHQPTSGEIMFKGKKVNFSSPLNALECGISMIHQEINLVPTVSISENIWLGRETLFTKFGFIQKEKRDQMTQKLFQQIGLALDIHEEVEQLSVAQKQMVEIARAVSYSADLIIMDEPTSALTESETEKLYEIIRDLKAKGVAIIFISHKLDEIFEICDKATVLRDGEYIETCDVKDLNQDKLVSMIVGRALDNMFPKVNVEIGEPILEVKGLTRNGVFEDVSFELKKGEILGLCGLMGAGRTEIVSTIFGKDSLDAGTIILEGEEIKVSSPQDAIRHGIAMVTEDRFGSGIMSVNSIKANMTLAVFPKFGKGPFYDKQKEDEAFLDMASQMQLKYAGPNFPISSLSGGNQQKVIIGRWLLTNPKVLILDEPTRGIDVGSKSEIHRIIGEMVKNGLSIILVSSEMPELLGVADRILVIRHGKIVYECDAKEASQEELITYAFGAATL